MSTRLSWRSGHAGQVLRSPALVVALVATFLHTACSDKSAPETTVPAGFVAVRDKGAGFAVGVPADWVQIPLPSDIDEFDAKARELQAANRALGPAIIQARQLLQYRGKLMAVSPDGRQIVNLTVDKAREKNLDEIGNAVVPGLEQNGATNVTREQSDTGAGRALRLTFKYPLPQGDSTVIADEVQYYVLHDGKTFVITVINGSTELAGTIASTLRLR